MHCPVPGFPDSKVASNEKLQELLEACRDSFVDELQGHITDKGLTFKERALLNAVFDRITKRMVRERG